MRLAAILMTLLLTGCAGTQSHLRLLESDGTIRADVSDDPSYDYKIFIRNTKDIGWNGNDESDRISAAKLMFEDSCKSVQVIDQTPLKTGKYLFGDDAITWIMKVKCIR
jgi:hypothetical protein